MPTTMPTPAEITANRAAAIATVRAEMGLADAAPSTWSYEMRQAYNKRLATYIASRPELFAASEVATAAKIQAKPADDLEDDGFDFGLFADEVANNAAELNPVPSLAKSLKWLLPVAGILALVFWFAPRIGAGVGAARKRS